MSFAISRQNLGVGWVGQVGQYTAEWGQSETGVGNPRFTLRGRGSPWAPPPPAGGWAEKWLASIGPV